MRRVKAAIYTFLFVVFIAIIFRHDLRPVYAEPEASWKVIPICVEPGNQVEPSISGDIIAWRGQQGFVYDLSTGNGVSLNMSPVDVSGNLVVGVSGGDITMYNVSADIYIPICTHPADQYTPAIDGTRVVWTDTRNGYDIYMYDIISEVETQITYSSAAETNPDISGDKIVYRKEENGTWSVGLYDLSTKKEIVIATNMNDDCHPAIDGNTVVWTHYCEILLYNITNEKVTPKCVNIYRKNLASISGDIVAWNDGRHTGSMITGNDIYAYNITSGEEIRITPSTVAKRFLSQHSVSNGRIVWADHEGPVTAPFSGDIYAAIPDAQILLEFRVETNKNTYLKGESVYISGGFTRAHFIFKNANANASVLLNITVMSSTSIDPIYTVYSNYINVVEGQRINFTDLNDGKPFEWNTSANHGSFKIRATVHLESPYYCNIINESEVFDVNIAITINPTFNDNTGLALDPLPTMWTIQLPNGTIREASGPTTYNLTQGGNCSITSITWQGSDISPDTKPTILLNSNTTWTPTINCKVYSFTVDPIFYDITGTALIQPSSWSISFPNDTVRTVSSPVTYNQTQIGKYSIVSIIWKGVEVIPDIMPTTSLTSDMLWSPSINCLLPTSLSISLGSSTSYVGFKVEINGNLTCNEVGLSGTHILLSYSVTGGESWNDITLLNTTSNGGYSAVWMPSATGNYLVRAIWSGNSTYPGTTTIINLAVTPFEEQNIFSVTSNSTVSELAFNSTSRELSFTVTGPSGTTGYINVYIAKTLVDNIADVKVYLDGDQLNYTITSTDDSWLLHFTYSHSTHTIAISLGPAPFIPPQLITPLSLSILAVALAVATALLIFKIRKGTPPTILNGVFSKSKQTQIATTIDMKRRKTMLKKRVGSIY